MVEKNEYKREIKDLPCNAKGREGLVGIWLIVFQEKSSGAGKQADR